MTKALTQEEWLTYLDTTWKKCLFEAWGKELNSMNDDIIKLARDCGINFHQAGWPELERFAEFVEEEKKEQCAQIAERLGADFAVIEAIRNA